MKAKKDHEVPLTDEMIALLEVLPRIEGKSLVFVGDANDGGMSPNALLNVLDAGVGVVPLRGAV